VKSVQDDVSQYLPSPQDVRVPNCTESVRAMKDYKKLSEVYLYWINGIPIFTQVAIVEES